MNLFQKGFYESVLIKFLENTFYTGKGIQFEYFIHDAVKKPGQFELLNEKFVVFLNGNGSIFRKASFQLFS